MASSSRNPEWPRSTQTHSLWKIRWTTLKHLDWFLMPLISSCDQTRWRLSGAGAQAVPLPQCGAVYHMLWLLGGAVPIVFFGFHRLLWPDGICGGADKLWFFCGVTAWGFCSRILPAQLTIISGMCMRSEGNWGLKTPRKCKRRRSLRSEEGWHDSQSRCWSF